MLRKHQDQLALAVHTLCLVPLTKLSWDFYLHRLGPHPVFTLSHSTGFWALTLLLLSLSVTPLRKLTSQNWLTIFRRVFGLYAFVYACIHFSIYLVFKTTADTALADIISHRYTLAGALSLLLLSPLAVTSTKGWQKRLKKRWKTLHFLVFPATTLAILHFFLLVKSDTTVPTRFLIVFLALCSLRWLPFFRKG